MRTVVVGAVVVLVGGTVVAGGAVVVDSRVVVAATVVVDSRVVVAATVVVVGAVVVAATVVVVAAAVVGAVVVDGVAISTLPLQLVVTSARAATPVMTLFMIGVCHAPRKGSPRYEPLCVDTRRQKTLRASTRPHSEIAPARDGRVAKKSPQKPPPMAPPSIC